jgi:hypothetical protein
VHLRRSLLILLSTFALAAPARAQPPVPQGFVGINVDLTLIDPWGQLGGQLDRMVSTGVESVRVPFDWASAQPCATTADPTCQGGNFTDVGGVPTDFTQTDRVVLLAAERGLTVLPVVLYAPAWDAGSNPEGGFPPPARPGPYAAYLTALINRYGPNGTFWAQNPTIRRLPIRLWQVWNEANLSIYWPQPFARSYVALLKASRAAIKRADRGAKLVLGALTDVEWRSLAQMYRVPGGRSSFDVVAIDSFTRKPGGDIRILQIVRQVMNASGDARKPLIATELSWTSGLHQTSQSSFDWNTTEAGQAHNIAVLLPLLAAHRRQLGLLGFYYYTWAGYEHPQAPAFNFSGLVKDDLTNGSFVAKPALAAFRRAALSMEGCRTKTRIALRCAS